MAGSKEDEMWIGEGYKGYFNFFILKIILMCLFLFCHIYFKVYNDFTFNKYRYVINHLIV